MSQKEVEERLLQYEKRIAKLEKRVYRLRWAFGALVAIALYYLVLFLLSISH